MTPRSTLDPHYTSTRFGFCPADPHARVRSPAIEEVDTSKPFPSPAQPKFRILFKPFTGMTRADWLRKERILYRTFRASADNKVCAVRRNVAQRPMVLIRNGIEVEPG